MPIDASIYRNIEQPPSTLQTLGAIQQFQQRGMEIQAQQRQLAAQQQLDQAYAGALTKDENGNPKIDENALFSHIPGHLIPATMEQFAKTKKSVADLQEAQGKVSQLHADLFGNLASTVKAAGYDPQTFLRGLKLAQAQGLVDGPTATQYSMKVIEGGSAAVKEITDQVLAGSPENLKRQNAIDVANIRAKKGLEQKSGVLNGQQVQGVFDPNTGKTNVAGQDVTNQFQPPTAALNAEQRLQQPLVEANIIKSRAEGVKAQAEADQLTALNGMTGPASKFPDVQPGQKNEPFLASLPAGLASQVKLMAEGKLAVPSGAALRAPYWQGLLQATAKYDPSFDAVNYNARNKTRLAFTSGKEAGQVNAINTVIGHLDNLSKAADALGNSNYTMFNTLANALSKATGSPKVTNFDTIKKAVSDEVTRVWRQAGGSEKDIEAAQQNLDSSNSESQLHGAIATYGDLLESKLGSLNEQYRQGMGTDKIDILTPQSRATLSRLEAKAGKPAGSLTANLPSGATREAPAQSGTPAVGATMQKFGATYKWDGTHYVKQ